MSYSRTYQETVSETRTFHYNYPASEHGGSDSITETIEIPVTIVIDVDTQPFDLSVGECKGQVSLLTGSVIATEAAQIAAKVESSEMISDTIVAGFYDLIKSEISQQLAQIQPRVEALSVELFQHQESCISKKKQLEGDFARITERYSKIFTDLDKEIRHKILSLNQAAFDVHSKLTAHVERSFRDISTGISTIYNKEGNNLQSMLFSIRLKNGALLLIDSAKKYLFSEKNLSSQLKQILIPINIGIIVTRQIPVLYFETENKSNLNEGHIISSEMVQALRNDENQNKLKESFSQSSIHWTPINIKNREDINTFLQLELRNGDTDKQVITPRVAKQIMQLWTNNANIQTNCEI